mgnify:CR=1 FL=1
MLHITPVTVHCKQGHIVGDCSTNGDSTSGGTFNGSIVDRLALGYNYTHAQPVLIGELPATTSTAGARFVSLSIKLRHGDSSGGGDLADLNTGLDADAVEHYTTQGESTDWKTFTTGLLRMQCSPKAYPLMGAKRFIAPAATVLRAGKATSTAAGNLFTCALGLTLLKQDQETGLGDFGIAPGGAGNGSAIGEAWKTTSTAT